MIENTDFDVIIIGGSYAGFSAAMALGRSLKNVLIIDSGLPCNRQTPYAHNFITRDGESPGEIAAKAKTQVLSYNTVKFMTDLAINGQETRNGFLITTQSGKEIATRKLIFATGIKDMMPDIKGFAECWGISAIHCPYCHGYEFRGQKTGIFANGDSAFHLATLVNNLTENITILTSGEPAFNPEQIAKLDKHHIKIKTVEISEIQHEHGHLTNLVFKDGTKEGFKSLYAAIPFKQHSDIPASLGCELTDIGLLKVDMFQKTTIDGVYACGDNSSPLRAVSHAIATGTISGAIANKQLTEEAF